MSQHIRNKGCPISGANEFGKLSVHEDSLTTHQPHFKCSVATCGWWIPDETEKNINTSITSVWQKPTQYRRAVIFQLKINFKKFASLQKVLLGSAAAGEEAANWDLNSLQGMSWNIHFMEKEGWFQFEMVLIKMWSSLPAVKAGCEEGWSLPVKRLKKTQAVYLSTVKFFPTVTQTEKNWSKEQ